MLPKKGCSGISMPGANRANHALCIEGNDFQLGIRKFLGQKPGLGPKALYA